MKLTFLGTGTSHGVPTIGCKCPVCTSKDSKNKRFRCSALITTNKNRNYLIDVGPDFRMQALTNNITQLDGVFITHAHADHLFGMDDLRMFSTILPQNHPVKKDSAAAKPPVKIYGSEKTLADIKHRFDYVFIAPPKEGGGRPNLNLQPIDSTIVLDNLEITPVPMLHGHMATFGYLFTETEEDGQKISIAYLTDCSEIPESSIKLINEKKGLLTHTVIDALRIETHSTHFSYLQAIQATAPLHSRHVWFTHMAHNTGHNETAEYIKQQLKEHPELNNDCTESILPAYDTLTVKA